MKHVSLTTALVMSSVLYFFSLLFRFLSELILIFSLSVAYSSPIDSPAHFTVRAYITLLYLGQTLLTPCVGHLSKHCVVWF